MKKPAKKKATRSASKKKPAAKKATPKKAAKKATKKPTKKATPKKVVAVKAIVKPKKEMPAASTTKLSVGDVAPSFSLPGDDGKTHSLADANGKPVVVYFYPRDDTPGCTTEACDFRDNMARISTKAVVYGVSKDSLKSHDKFKQKYNLNFTLLSDEDLATHRAYGAWGEKIMYGKPVVGVIRSTYLVKDGKIAAAWPRVKVAGHVDAVINAIDSL